MGDRDKQTLRRWVLPTALCLGLLGSSLVYRYWNWEPPASRDPIGAEPEQGDAEENEKKPGLPQQVSFALTPEEQDGYKGRVGRLRRPLRQDLDRIIFEHKQGTLFNVRLEGKGAKDAFGVVDLGLFVPKLPSIAERAPALTRLSLSQQELNRIETSYPPRPDGAQLFLANNCLKRGLWEVGITRPVDRDSHAAVELSPSERELTFHAWFNLEQDLYAALFNEVNDLPFEDVQEYLLDYPSLAGFVLPLGALRKIKSETKLTGFRSEGSRFVARLAEQEQKAPYLLNPELSKKAMMRYSDLYDEATQPIRMAKFIEPGLYDISDAMRFDLSFLSKPKAASLRQVVPEGRGSRKGTFSEVAVTFENGSTLLFSHAQLHELPVRKKPPQELDDCLKLTFGLGTPLVYATAEQRQKQGETLPLQYLFLIDGRGRHVDNHHVGLDRVYLWRDAKQLNIWLVGYERIAIVGHLTLPWPTS